MTITPRGMSIQEAYRLHRSSAFLVNRRYQRKLVWTVAEKQLLISSILEGYPIPLLLLAERPEFHGPGRYEILDGMQRFDAIFSFVEQRFAYEEAYFDLNEFARARQAADEGCFTPVTASDRVLTPKQCADLLDYQLAVTVYPTSLDRQVTQVFSRINANGRQLSAQEKRQAGVVNPFADLVRKLSSELRGDVSRDIVLLAEMPHISVDSSRERQDYGVKAEETLWCRQGILSVKELREGEDEQMVVDLVASVLLGAPLAASREKLDELYDDAEPLHAQLLNTLSSYGASRLDDELKATFSVIVEMVDSYGGGRSLRQIVRAGSGGSGIKTPFYTIFMAFFDLLVRQQRSPADDTAILAALQGVSTRLTSAHHYATTQERNQNINLVTGLIQNYFAARVPPALTHGPALSLDFENALRRSRIETPRYEFKQGLLRLSTERERDTSLIDRLVNTITAIANLGPNAEGYLFLGVADTKQDADRVETIYGETGAEISGRYVVGIDREARHLGQSVETYLAGFVAALRRSELPEPLKMQALAALDVVEYRGKTVIRITVPRQKAVSFVGDRAFTREGPATVEVTGGPRLAALVQLFS
jgi:Protein of unknown function DUF262